VGLFKTIEFIVDNPMRSRLWKTIDVTVLCFLWGTSVVFVIGAWDSQTFEIGLRVVLPITVLATVRGWYRHPSLSRRARDSQARRRALESDWRTQQGDAARP
jgi:hypothetical protein